MSPALTFLLGVAAKASLLIAGAALAALAARRAPAAVRHAIWTAAVLGLLLLPALTLVLPAYRSSLVDNAIRAAASRLPSLEAASAADEAGGTRGGTPALGADELGVFTGQGEAAGRPLDAGTALIAVWLAGVLCVGGRAVRSRLAARRLVRRARPAPGWEPAPVAGIPLLESDEVAAPALAGIRAPVVLLPPGSAAWPREQKDAVLLHELAHAERRDLLVDLLAQAACALHWFNPLAWYAAGRLAVERERACDDRVLVRGGDALAYASVLLAVARAALSGTPAPRGLIAMARPTELESRFAAILDPRRRRAALSGPARVALAACAALLLLPLAAFRTGQAAVAQVRAPAVAAGDTTLLDPRSELVPLPYAALAQVAAAVPATGPDAAAIAMLRRHLDRVPRGPEDLVRERTVWALSRVRNGRLVEPLLESLGDNDWKVRAYAAWGLAVAGDHRAIPRLIPLLRDPVWRVRAMAASALAQHPDPAAFDAMAAALGDDAWQVRISAVHYLEDSGDPRALGLLRPLLRDPHTGTRIITRNAVARITGR